MKSLQLPNTLSLSHRLAAAVLAFGLIVVAVIGVYAFHDSPAHGGAFDGPCTYQADGPGGPVANLTLTDYGPPVQVHYLVVEERDNQGVIINANRTEIGTTVSTHDTRTFTVPAISGTATCRLLNWG